MMPPLITVGSKPPASSSAATMDVVVVLPCVPAMATQLLSRISSASISARRATGRRCARAAMSSGLSGLIAEEMTTTLASERFSTAWLIAIFTPLSQAFDIGVLGLIGPLHRVTEVHQHLGEAAHADAADADEMHWTDVVRQSHAALRSCAPETAAILMKEVDGRNKSGLKDSPEFSALRSWRRAGRGRPSVRPHRPGRSIA